MSNYAAGRRVEWAVRDDLARNGYTVFRAAGSKGPADLIALKDGEVLFVNVKRDTLPSPAERAALLALARLLPGVGAAIWAHKPAGDPIRYRRLVGAGPTEHVAWLPDWAFTG